MTPVPEFVAVKVELKPLHIAVGLATAVNVGNGTTKILIVRCGEPQPKLLLPTTVYIVVELGVSVITAVVAPFAVQV